MKKKLENGKRVFHAIFGWCVIDALGKEKAIINCEADIIEYFIMGKGAVRYVRDENGRQIVCVPISELYQNEESVPDIFSLQKTAMNVKLTNF